MKALLAILVGFLLLLAPATQVRADSYATTVSWSVPGGGNTTVQPPDSQGPTQFGVFAGFFYRVSGQSVTFVDSSQSGIPIVSWAWSFGDGSTSTVQNPTHAYAPHGLTQVFNVTLKSCTAQRCASTTQPVSIVNVTALASLALFMAFMFLVLTVASRHWKKGRRGK